MLYWCWGSELVLHAQVMCTRLLGLFNCHDWLIINKVMVITLHICRRLLSFSERKAISKKQHSVVLYCFWELERVGRAAVASALPFALFNCHDRHGINKVMADTLHIWRLIMVEIILRSCRFWVKLPAYLVFFSAVISPPKWRMHWKVMLLMLSR